MKEELRKESAEWLKALAIGVIIFAFIRTFFLSNYVVEGESMMPTLEDGNKLIVNKIGYQISDFDRFDVIVFHHNDKEDFVKRVIGLPGDKVEYHHEFLYVNDERIEEPFLESYKEANPFGHLTGDFTLEEITGSEVVPEGKLFVMGDNRGGSWDGRHFGFISIEQVVGKVDVKYWPLNELDASL
ncbi:signal peptidase I [Cytobacillus gottheilii]|uniref:signal peptidase I n=1 Tax=Cytobacillus gottheilii TaxID=859144 RepID=UPI0009BA0603|nr:signal peptidase I [Cytobacillus gottheilii]